MTYDLAGNRKTEVDATGTTYTPDALDRYSSITGQRQEPGINYDADGNLTQDAIWTYAYDGENRLKTLTKSGQTLSFTYDYAGRRIRKTVTGTGAYDIKFLWSGWKLAAELASNGTTVNKTFVWGRDFSDAQGAAGGAGSLLAQISGGAVSYAIPDALGNIVAYANSSGTILASVEYSPCGKGLNANGAWQSYPIGFSGQYMDWEPGIVYYGLRYYAPKHGRFINRDPIEEAGGNNLYNFVGNAPTAGWDTLGLWRYCYIVPNAFYTWTGPNSAMWHDMEICVDIPDFGGTANLPPRGEEGNGGQGSGSGGTGSSETPVVLPELVVRGRVASAGLGLAPQLVANSHLGFMTARSGGAAPGGDAPNKTPCAELAKQKAYAQHVLQVNQAGIETSGLSNTDLASLGALLGGTGVAAYGVNVESRLAQNGRSLEYGMTLYTNIRPGYARNVARIGGALGGVGIAFDGYAFVKAAQEGDDVGAGFSGANVLASSTALALGGPAGLAIGIGQVGINVGLSAYTASWNAQLKEQTHGVVQQMARTAQVAQNKVAEISQQMTAQGCPE